MRHCTVYTSPWDNWLQGLLSCSKICFCPFSPIAPLIAKVFVTKEAVLFSFQEPILNSFHSQCPSWSSTVESMWVSKAIASMTRKAVLYPHVPLKFRSHLQVPCLHSPKTATFLEKHVYINPKEPHGLCINALMSISTAKLHLALLSQMSAGGRVCKVKWMPGAWSVIPGGRTWVGISCSFTHEWSSLCGFVMICHFLVPGGPVFSSLHIRGHFY